MAHDGRTDPDDPFRDVELTLMVDGREIPLNAFSRTAIARVVVAAVSSYRGVGTYRERPPKKVEIVIS